MRHKSLAALAMLSWETFGALAALSATLPSYLGLTFCFAIAAMMDRIVCRLANRTPCKLLDKRIVMFFGMLVGKDGLTPQMSGTTG
ncbi:MAG: hypothetical protein ROO70_18995 [Labrenzia sp.]